MVEHGTRSMYTYYGCRCEACCRAEHQQYLKRKESQARKRTYSKWGDIQAPVKKEAQRQSDRRRYANYTHTKPFRQRIRWWDLMEQGEKRCAICGCLVDPEDFWINQNGRKCFGKNYPTVDHIVPLKSGGTDTADNVQLTCKRCNSRKGAKYELAG